MRDFRKHTSWYLTGYPVGGEMRRRFANISTLGRVGRSDRRRSIRRSPSSMVASASAAATPTARSVSHCPTGYLDHLDDVTVPDDSHVMALSGG